jgi:hypothetical protein
MMFDLVMRTKSNFDADMVGRRATVVFNVALKRAAEEVQTIARDSIRNAPRKSFDELSPRDQRIYLFRLKYNSAHGKPLPVLPFVPSKPGEPPRSPTGKLPRSIVFDVDENAGVAVIGPVRFSGKSGVPIPAILEFGNGRTLARPYMRPALKKASPKFVRLFEEIL